MYHRRVNGLIDVEPAIKISITQFRTSCFKVLDQVHRTRTEVVLTKRGKPVAKIVPIADEADPLLGALEGVGRTVGDLTEPVVAPGDWAVEP